MIGRARHRVALGAVLGLAIGSAPMAAASSEPDVEAPVIAHRPIRTAAVGRALRIRAEVTDPSGVFAAAVYVRSGDASDFVSLPMRPVSSEPDVYEARIPAQQVRGTLRYFVEAFDILGNGPTRLGNPREPLVVELAGSAPAGDDVAPAVEPPPAPPPMLSPTPRALDLASPGSPGRTGLSSTQPDAESAPPSWAGASAARPEASAEGTPTWVWIVAGVGALALAGAGVGVFYAVRGDPVDFVRVDVVGPDPTGGL